MSCAAKTRFDVEALQKRAGDKVYARGAGYAASGQVLLLSLGADKVIAEVLGTERYSVMLQGAGERAAGVCNCPAFEDAGFCKHLVATALTVNDLLVQGAGIDRLRQGIETHLAGLSRQELVNYMMSLAETDTILFRRLVCDAQLEPREDGECGWTWDEDGEA